VNKIYVQLYDFPRAVRSTFLYVLICHGVTENKLYKSRKCMVQEFVSSSSNSLLFDNLMGSST